MSIICASRSDFSLVLGASARWPWGGGNQRPGRSTGLVKLHFLVKNSKNVREVCKLQKSDFQGGPI